MKKESAKIIALIIAAVTSTAINAKCLIKNSDNTPASPKRDALYLTLNQVEGCPLRAQDLKTAFLQNAAKVEPAMVANRGIHNPDQGSFSFFETVIGKNIAAGELFFGHFTTTDENGNIILNQSTSTGLMVELIAWDGQKGVFNFYELIGQGNSAQWFYRGDSFDILNDNAFIYREVPAGQPKFGKTLRCSACHSSGGPIMKELAAPHNDWWTISRPLKFGPNHPDQEVRTWVSQVIDAGQFAQSVVNGIQKLETSPSYQKAKSKLSLQEKLRPLFCENEINLESNFQPLETGGTLQIPSGFYLNPMLAQPQVSLDSQIYVELLKANNLRFPETRNLDADHAWLTPVKGFSDLLAIQTLLNQSFINEDFALSVLAIDMEHPLFSQERCALLKLVPEFSLNWQAEFLAKLKHANSPAATELAKNLSVTKAAARIKSEAQSRSIMLQTTPAAAEQLHNLISLRQAVFKSEISHNPRGQILEPGFRVIFPTPGGK